MDRRHSLLRSPARLPAAAVIAVGLLPAVALTVRAPVPRALGIVAAPQAPGRIPNASTGSAGPGVVTLPDGSGTAGRHLLVSGRLPGTERQVIVVHPVRARSRSGYRLAISSVTRAGLAGTGCVYVINPASLNIAHVPEVCGTGSVRLPVGRYVLITHIVTPGAPGASTTVAIAPVRLTGNKRIVIDARKAVPFQVTLDRPHMWNNQLTEATTFPVHEVGVPGLVPFFDEVRGGGPGAIRRVYMLPARYPGLRFGYSADWVPESFAGASPPCILSGTYRGRVPAVLRYRARVRDLAEITTTGTASDGTSSAQLADSVLILHWQGLYVYGGLARRISLPGIAHIHNDPNGQAVPVGRGFAEHAIAADGCPVCPRWPGRPEHRCPR